MFFQTIFWNQLTLTLHYVVRIIEKIKHKKRIHKNVGQVKRKTLRLCYYFMNLTKIIPLPLGVVSVNLFIFDYCQSDKFQSKFQLNT